MSDFRARCTGDGASAHPPSVLEKKGLHVQQLESWVDLQRLPFEVRHETDSLENQTNLVMLLQTLLIFAILFCEFLGRADGIHPWLHHHRTFVAFHAAIPVHVGERR